MKGTPNTALGDGVRARALAKVSPCRPLQMPSSAWRGQGSVPLSDCGVWQQVQPQSGARGGARFFFDSHQRVCTGTFLNKPEQKQMAGLRSLSQCVCVCVWLLGSCPLKVARSPPPPFVVAARARRILCARRATVAEHIQAHHSVEILGSLDSKRQRWWPSPDAHPLFAAAACRSRRRAQRAPRSPPLARHAHQKSFDRTLMA